MTPWHWLFWLAAAYILYTYLGYPLLLALWRTLRRKRTPEVEPGYAPLVSVLITVRNEKESIGPKLEDFLNQEYPRDRMEIWVASDQSTDGTNDVVREYQARDPRIHLVDFTENIGKAEAINRTMERVRGEVVVMADARQRIDPHAVRFLAAHFADPKVGVVGAEMLRVDESGLPSSEATGLYWRYELVVRRLESDLGLLTGVSGPLLAMRTSVFRPIPPGSYCDDVTVALHAREAGFEVRWETRARLYERIRDPYTEFRRKVRTLVGNYQLLQQFWPMYLPWRGRTAFSLLSHKVCRLFIPVALGLLYLASLALAPGSLFYALALAAQTAFYLAGVLGMAFAGFRRSRVVNACGAFCLLNWAALVALAHVLRHGPRIQWR